MKIKSVIDPKVSIIVPVYNVKNYLKKCLDSILSQTLKEIEVICVDDGSTDGSSAELDAYAIRDARIKVVHKENSGYGNTMNVGIDMALGRYIGIVESDDYISEGMFAKLYYVAEKNNVDIVKSDHYTFTGIGKKQKSEYHWICPARYYNKVLNTSNCPDIFSFEMMNWTGIYKTEFIRSYKIQHNETPGASFQDNGFWFQTITFAKSIIFVNEAFYYYRQDNPGSSINCKEKVFCICDEYKYIYNIIKDKKVPACIYKSYFEKKVFNYLNTYKRIDDEYKMIFLERIAKEFSEDLHNHRLDIDSIDNWVLAQANRIIDSPRLYYLEDGLYSYEKKYHDVHDRLIQLRNSNEFKTGIYIKKLFGLIK